MKGTSSLSPVSGGLLGSMIVRPLVSSCNKKDLMLGSRRGRELKSQLDVTKHHSFFFSIFLKIENGLAVFRGKKYPFNVKWTAESGIMLLKS